MRTEESELDRPGVKINLLTEAELDAVSGGMIRWIDIHMPYLDFIKWPGGEPSPTRYA
jgi:hypothetical protein